MPTTRQKIKKYLLISVIAGFGLIKLLFLSQETKSKSTSVNLSEADFKIAISKMRLRHPDLPSNPVDVEKKLIRLGSKLFFDTGFSQNNKVSCATCHRPENSFTDGKKTSEGIALTAMNAPTLINVYAGQWFFWNGRADSLEAQALGPVENAKEHGFSRIKVAQRLETYYKTDYEDIFGTMTSILKIPDISPPPSSPPFISDPVASYALSTLGNSILQKSILRTAQSQGQQPIEILKRMSAGADQVANEFQKLPDQAQKDVNTIFANFGKAISAFERTIKTEDAPFDRFVDAYLGLDGKSGQTKEVFSQAFGDRELRGLRLFTGRGQCTTCHQGPYFTDQQFHNIGLGGSDSNSIDLGRSQGLLIAQQSPFNCLGSFLHAKLKSEGCRELEYLETESAEAVGAFKTPTLRNNKFTAPYGHDGRFAKINDIIHHYNQLQEIPAVGHREELLAPLNLTDAEISDLESFLGTLNSSVTYFKED